MIEGIIGLSILFFIASIIFIVTYAIALNKYDQGICDGNVTVKNSLWTGEIVAIITVLISIIAFVAGIIHYKNYGGIRDFL